MRLFIAVKANDDFNREVLRLKRKLADTGADVKWVEPENLHFTLHFLGDVDAAKLPAVKEAVQAAASAEPFEINLTGLGAFPSAERPQVLWAGAEDKTRGLERIYDAIGAKLRAAGFETETRPFVAHMTLGRARGLRGARALSAAIAELSRKTPPVKSVMAAAIRNTTDFLFII